MVDWSRFSSQSDADLINGRRRTEGNDRVNKQRSRKEMFSYTFDSRRAFYISSKLQRPYSTSQLVAAEGPRGIKGILFQEWHVLSPAIAMVPSGSRGRRLGSVLDEPFDGSHSIWQNLWISTC